MSQTFSLELKSEFSEIEKITALAEQIGRDVQLKEEVMQRVLLALSEAVTNAVIHGNRENTEKKVSVSIRVTAQVVILIVKDEGKGFDPDSIPDPIEKKNLLKTGGRGLFLMGEVCDEVRYSEKGSTVTLTINR